MKLICLNCKKVVLTLNPMFEGIKTYPEMDYEGHVFVLISEGNTIEGV